MFAATLDDSAINNTSMLMDAPGVHNYGIKFLTLDAFVDDGLHTQALGIEQKYVGLVLHSALLDDH